MFYMYICVKSWLIFLLDATITYTMLFIFLTFYFVLV